MITFKGGKHPKKEDSRNLQFKKYLTGTLPTVPFTFDQSFGILYDQWQVLYNDKAGDCVIAAALHLFKAWFKSIGIDYEPTDQDAINLYKVFNPNYNPETGEGDNGCNILDVIKYLCNTGIVINGITHKFGAFTELDIKNINEFITATYLFHGTFIGVQLPQSAVDQFNNNQDWVIVKGSPIVGGHGIIYIAVPDKDGMNPVTWGKKIRATLEWILEYTDEAYAIIGNDYLNGGKTTEGFDIDQLKADLVAIKKAPPVPVHESWIQLIIDWFEKVIGRKPVSKEEAKDAFQKYIGSL
jgi:hypothetical protein